MSPYCLAIKSHIRGVAAALPLYNMHRCSWFDYGRKVGQIQGETMPIHDLLLQLLRPATPMQPTKCLTARAFNPCSVLMGCLLS